MSGSEHNNKAEICSDPVSFPGQEAYGDHFTRNPILVKYTALVMSPTISARG